jgi:predicted nucleic acid-binding protein
MTGSIGVLVFDTGPLSHFAQEGWLGILRLVVGNRTAVIPDTVIDELRAGVQGRAHLQLVLDASWIEHHVLMSEEELAEFTKFASLLVAKGRNLGESGVLAYAKANGATAVVDDGPARKIARADNVAHIGTLGLLCEALRENLLTVDLISAVADHLLEGEYRLPFGTGGFAKWAHDQGLVPPVG